MLRRFFFLRPEVCLNACAMTRCLMVTRWLLQYQFPYMHSWQKLKKKKEGHLLQLQLPSCIRRANVLKMVTGRLCLMAVCHTWLCLAQRESVKGAISLNISVLWKTSPCSLCMKHKEIIIKQVTSYNLRVRGSQLHYPGPFLSLSLTPQALDPLLKNTAAWFRPRMFRNLNIRHSVQERWSYLTAVYIRVGQGQLGQAAILSVFQLRSSDDVVLWFLKQ